MILSRSLQRRCGAALVAAFVAGCGVSATDPDAASIPDAGLDARVDAALAPDAAITSDAALTPDAAVAPDAPELTPDAAELVPDAFVPPDAAVPVDADLACGNGVLDTGEVCDTAAVGPGACPTECDDADSCTSDSFVGADCTLACRHVARVAGPVDTCCPSGATPATDPDCVPTCGDGVVQASERCDVAATGVGACPVSCDDGEACTVDTRIGSGCGQYCTHGARTTGLTDGCCPSGATTATDPDCAGACGARFGAEVRVAPGVRATDIAISRLGSTYAVVWRDPDPYAIYLQRFDAGAVAIGPRVTIADTSGVDYLFFGVDVASDGARWGVAYGRRDRATGSSGPSTMTFQLVGSDGALIGGPIDVNATTPRGTGNGVQAVSLAYHPSVGFAVASSDSRSGGIWTYFQTLGADGTAPRPFVRWNARLARIELGAAPDGTFGILGDMSNSAYFWHVDADGVEVAPQVTLGGIGHQYANVGLFHDGNDFGAVLTHYTSDDGATIRELRRGPRLADVTEIARLDEMTTGYWLTTSATRAGGELLSVAVRETLPRSGAYRLGWLRAGLSGPSPAPVTLTEVDLAVVSASTVATSSTAIEADGAGHALVGWIDGRRTTPEPFVRWVTYGCP